MNESLAPNAGPLWCADNDAEDDRMRRRHDRDALAGIFLAVAAIGVWLSINSLMAKAFDPYPFILLNLVLSCLAALQAPVIMMSQNRQAAHDRLDAQHDYEVNTKAELEIVGLHAKLDEIRDQKWVELMRAQEQQLALLAGLASRLGREGTT
jgi:uncharacterized membrane protein